MRINKPSISGLDITSSSSSNKPIKNQNNNKIRESKTLAGFVCLKNESKLIAIEIELV